MIRFAESSDVPAIRQLWETCFPDESGFNDYFFSHFFSFKHVLLATSGDTVCAMLQMLPYRLRGVGEVTYIYGACTDPAYRRQGYMALLLRRSFALDLSAGRGASILIPAEKWLFDFYQQFDYSPFFSVNRYEIQKQRCGELPRRLNKADLPQMAALYASSVPQCAVERDNCYWNAQLDMFDQLGKGAFGWFCDGRLTAYAFCWEDNAQEAIGMTDTQAQGLLQALDRDRLVCTTIGDTQALGCIHWHKEPQAVPGYMNLMLN